MRKFYILTIIICVLALTLCIEKTFYNLIDLSLGYEYVLWCGKNDKEYIKEETGLKGNFNIIVCNANYQQELFVIKEFPYGIGKKIEIPYNGSLIEYIKENNSTGEVILKSIFPYITLRIILVVVINISLKKISQNHKI